jgi:ribosomal protein S18 acetylase RimI-like enzyme
MKTLTSRAYENQQDYEQMLNLLMEARSLTSDWRYAHVGELAFSYFNVFIHLDAQQHIRLWHDHGKMVGYAILGEDPALDWQLHPEYEWSGIEEQALDWAEARVEQLRQQDGETWGGDLVSGSRQDDPRRIAFLGSHGFKYCGEFAEVNMLRSLAEPIPEPKVPQGFVVREFAGLSELANRASIQREVWQPWTVGNVSDKDYACFMQLPNYRRDLDIVTVAPDGTIAAYVNGWIDPVNKIGDLGPLGALEAYRNRGLTRAAIYECLRRMRTYGMDRVCVSTGFSNEPAQNLYRSVGFEIVNCYLDYTKKNIQ